MLVLDTDHMTHLGNRGSPEWKCLTDHLRQNRKQTPVTTIVTYEEQFRGWMEYIARAKSLDDQVQAYKRLSKHADRYRRARLLEFDETAAAKYQELRDARINIGPHDLKIAAITLIHGATLLSGNFKDFTKVPGLRVEDWTV